MASIPRRNSATGPSVHVPSPDGTWSATEIDDDLALRNANGEVERVTQDGSPEHRWEVDVARWSPDGATLAVTRVDTRGVDRLPVVRWLETAAGVPGFIGFAVGRTTFWEAIAAYEAGENTSEEAVEFIAARFREWVDVFERARARPHTRDGGRRAFERAFQPTR